jgi:zinc/manganese transport system permease protein
MIDAFHVMLWPLLACLLLPGILVYYGLHIVQRGIIFVDLALAQVAALGTCIAILLGHEPDTWQNFAWSLGFTLAGAAVFTWTRSLEKRVPQEALIGIVYVMAAAAGILVLSRNPEGNEELRRTLVGDVLLVRPIEVGRTFLLYVLIGAVHVVFRRQFLALSFGAETGTRHLRAWDFLFYGLFGLVVTSFLHVGGVLLVFSYLIVPAVCGGFLATGFRARLVIGWMAAIAGSVAGICSSYAFDLPTGAAIVCALGCVLLVCGGAALSLRRAT